MQHFKVWTKAMNIYSTTSLMLTVNFANGDNERIFDFHTISPYLFFTASLPAVFLLTLTMCLSIINDPHGLKG